MYRSRLGSDIDRATLEYLSSASSDIQIVRYDILCSQAHTIMLHDQKIITKSDAARILAALGRIDIADDMSGAEDIHEYIESRVIESAGMASGGMLQTGRSRNDQVSCDIRMKIRDDIGAISHNILELIETLAGLASAHQKTVMPLYTHLQRAQAGTLSHYMISCSDVLFRDLERLSLAYAHANQNPLGSGPAGGTSIDIDRGITSELLGFDGIVENSLDATSSRDFTAEYVSALTILMTGLSRIAEDLVLWSTDEFDFVELADALASPSSIMPHKKNPDIMELTRGKASEVIGCLVSVLSASKGLATGYGRDLQQAKESVWRASAVSLGALVVVRSALATMTVNVKNMRRAAQRSHIVALDIAEALAGHGVPFRQAHEITGRLVQAAHGSGRQLSKLTAPQIKDALKGTTVKPKEVAGIIAGATVSASLRSRASQGSAGFAQQASMIESRRARLAGLRQEASAREQRVADALDSLARRVSEISG